MSTPAADPAGTPADRTGTPAGPLPAEAFAALMREVMAGADRFGHRQHVELAWRAVRAYGTAAAVDLVGEGIDRTATAAGAPQKFHVTMTRAWVELVGLRAAADGEADAADGFDPFAVRHPELFDAALLHRHYRRETLAGDTARTSWVEPDLAPLSGPTD
ncbi:hypothetical protein [Streptomyces sp. NPDC051079]|uniref:hypothetical protein n=1 Tax=Streptomyces sp. NPDC051079 TaxID=3155043 RepID=UPI003450177E